MQQKPNETSREDTATSQSYAQRVGTIIYRDMRSDWRRAVDVQQAASRWLRRIPWAGNRFYMIGGSQSNLIENWRTEFLEIRWRALTGRVLFRWETAIVARKS